MRLLAESFTPEELNKQGYELYVGFRPESEGWGKKAEMKMKGILALRKEEDNENGKSEKREGGRIISVPSEENEKPERV